MGLLEEMLRAVGREKEADEVREYVDGSYQAYHTHWVRDGRIETNHMAELVRPIALGLLTEEEKKNAAASLNDMVRERVADAGERTGAGMARHGQSGGHYGLGGL